MDITSKILKYIIMAIVIYVLFRLLFNKQMANRDIALLTLILVSVMAIIEQIMLLSSSSNVSVQNSCDNYCEISKKPINQESLEHMSNVDTVVNNIDTQSNNSNNSGLTMQSDFSNTQLNQQYEAKLKERETELNNIAIQPTSQPIPLTQPTDPNITRLNDGSYDIKPYRNPQAKSIGSRAVDGVMHDESKYNYIDFNNFSMENVNTGSFEYGYSFLPPEKWYVVPPHPPVCVSEKKCPVCPVYTNGTNVDLKEWNSARRISAPDEINVEYIEEKLNSGR